MGKLHQTLAVETSKLNLFRKVIDEAVNTFSKKPNLFEGVDIIQTSRLVEEDPLYLEYPNMNNTVPVQETVPSKLEYVFDTCADYINLVAQKDKANREAKADLKIGDKVLLADVPATTLLFIENKFKVIRTVIEAAKTLDNALIWTKKDGLSDVWTTDRGTVPVKRTEPDFVTVAQATDKHPAQVKEITRERIMASKNQKNCSGLIQTKEKSELLARCDQIIEAAKRARQEANAIDVVDVNIASTLFNHILGK